MEEIATSSNLHGRGVGNVQLHNMGPEPLIGLAGYIPGWGRVPIKRPIYQAPTVRLERIAGTPLFSKRLQNILERYKTKPQCDVSRISWKVETTILHSDAWQTAEGHGKLHMMMSDAPYP